VFDKVSAARALARERARIEELQAAITTALPVGSSSSQVVAFLDARHIEHSEVVRESRTMYASTLHQRDWFMETGVYIVFHFNEAGLMTGFSVEQVATGP